MKVSGLQRKENIINNIEYILRSRGESKVSFASRTGVTRASLYKILDGKVNNVHRSTITRIADFFGVSCEIIENYDLEHFELVENTLSPDGNKNPAAVPVIPQSEFMSSFESRIGNLVTQYPVTWYFGDVSNMVALSVEDKIGKIFLAGDTLIIKRKARPVNKQLALYFSAKKGFFIREGSESIISYPEEGESMLGTVVEERIQ